jgi:hypothetical protein
MVRKEGGKACREGDLSDGATSERPSLVPMMHV